MNFLKHFMFILICAFALKELIYHTGEIRKDHFLPVKAKKYQENITADPKNDFLFIA